MSMFNETNDDSFKTEIEFIKKDFGDLLWKLETLFWEYKNSDPNYCAKLKELILNYNEYRRK